MTKEDAVSKAADWWTKMVLGGVWDNGDAPTEAINSWIKSFRPGPKPEEAEKVRKVFVELLEGGHNDLYCDYGNSTIDSVFKNHGLPYYSDVHCPQKAGTRLYEVNGDWRVEAKSGYGKPYSDI